jgi:hypothetical protein
VTTSTAEVPLVGQLVIRIKPAKGDARAWTVLNDVLAGTFELAADTATIERRILSVNRSGIPLSRFTMSPWSVRGTIDLELSGARLRPEELLRTSEVMRGPSHLREKGADERLGAWQTWLTTFSKSLVDGSSVGRVLWKPAALKEKLIVRDDAVKIFVGPTTRIEDLEPKVDPGHGLLVTVRGRARLSELIPDDRAKSELVALYPHGAERVVIALKMIGAGGAGGFVAAQDEAILLEQDKARILPRGSQVRDRDLIVTSATNLARDSKIEVPFVVAR